MQQVEEAMETISTSFNNLGISGSTNSANEVMAAPLLTNTFQVPTFRPREWFAAGKSSGNSSAFMSIMNGSVASFSCSSSRSIMEDYDTYPESQNDIGGSTDTSIVTQYESSTQSTKKRRKKPKRIIDESRAIEHSPNDILFGRGGHTNKNPGNIRFRMMALELRPIYDACSTKEEKYEVSEVFVNCMKAENRRFLERKHPDGSWFEVIGNGARKKASQALRERIR